MAKSSANPSRPSAVSQPISTDADLLDSKLASDDDGIFVFGKQTIIWVGIGLLLMIVGMLLMAGGSMPSPDVWDDSIIYSFRRITLAPIVILAGLGVITYAILKK